MGTSPGKSLVIGISSRALLDLEKENAVFEDNKRISRSAAIKAFIDYQQDHQDVIIPKGVAFPLVKALLNLNKTLALDGSESRIEVVIISRNHPACGLRILQSLAVHGLEIEQAAFTGGESVISELRMFNVDLFLSYEEQDVIAACKAGISAAKIFGGPSELPSADDTPLLAFDGDSTLFSNESDLAYDRGQMDEFTRFEKSNEGIPLGQGPLYRFVRALADLHSSGPIDNPPFRMALVTSRNFYLMRRPMETLRGWGIRLDKAYAIGKMKKQKVLKDLNALMFFDNDPKHCADVAECTPTAQILYAAAKVNGDERSPASTLANAQVSPLKNDFVLICRSYLNLKSGKESTKVLEQWFDQRVGGREEAAIREFITEFEASVKGTPVGSERPAKDAKNEKSTKLIDYLDLLAKKHFAE